MDPVSIYDLMSQYDGFLFDAYGVLIDGMGTLPHVPQLIGHLNKQNYPYLIVSNGSSKTQAEAVESYNSKGLDVGVEKVLNSGMLLEDYFVEHGLIEPKCFIIGNEESETVVKAAGGTRVHSMSEMDAMVVTNELPFNKDWLNDHLNELLQLIDSGRRPKMVVPNPDFIYPKSEGRFHLTAGFFGNFFNTALQARYPGENIRFDALGKPYAPIFQKASSILGSSNLLMLGDQVHTDILGARDFGIDSALLLTGVTDERSIENLAVQPTHILKDLS